MATRSHTKAKRLLIPSYSSLPQGTQPPAPSPTPQPQPGEHINMPKPTDSPSTCKCGVIHLRESLDESILCDNLQKRIIGKSSQVTSPFPLPHPLTHHSNCPNNLLPLALLPPGSSHLQPPRRHPSRSTRALRCQRYASADGRARSPTVQDGHCGTEYCDAEFAFDARGLLGEYLRGESGYDAGWAVLCYEGYGGKYK